MRVFVDFDDTKVKINQSDMAMTTGFGDAATNDDDDLECIEILSAQYRPTSSMLHHPTGNHCSDPQIPAIPATSVNNTASHPHCTAATNQLTSRTNRDLDAIRSVDDYEKENIYYFRPSTGATSSSNNRPGCGRKRSDKLTGVTVNTQPDSTNSIMIAMPIYNGEMVLLENPSCTDEKKPLTADERKRKRITLAVGIIAGMQG